MAARMTRMHGRHTRHKRRLIALAAIWLVLTSAPPVRAADPAPCWTPTQLAAVPAEAQVRRGIADAIRAVPRIDGDADNASTATTAAPLAPGQVIRRVELPAGVKRVALTFDLCEQAREIAGYDGRIIDALRAAGARATFFAGGKWMLTHAERARQLMADPLFEIGNHGWEHRNVRLLTDAGIVREITAAQRAYVETRRPLAERQCLGRDGTPASERAPAHMSLIRFPFGTCNERALKAAAAAGLSAIQWDIASGDPAPGQSARRLLQAVMQRVRPGSIMVFHANGRGWHTAEALPQIIKALQSQGYELVSVGELVATPGAQLVTADSCYDQRPGDLAAYDHLLLASRAGRSREKAPRDRRSPAPPF